MPLRYQHRVFEAALAGLALTLALACDDVTGPTDPTLVIRVSTSAQIGDADADGYTYSIDDGPSGVLRADDAARIGGLTPGTHLVRLDGLAPNCSVIGDNPRSIVIADNKPSVPTSVAFYVLCAPITGRVLLTIATSGPDPDPDGYFVTVAGAQRGIPTNGTLTIEGVRVGPQVLTLNGVSGNCAVDEPRSRSVTILFNATSQVAFTVKCVPAASLQVTTATAGVDLDLNGYVIDIRSAGGSSVSFAASANGVVTVPRLAPGNYVLTLFGLAPNCDLELPNARVVAIAAGSATPVTLNVTCVAPAQIAFVGHLGNNKEIYAINSNGTGTTRLTFGALSDVNPAWSPDGNRIAFSSERGEGLEIYVMGANGDTPNRLTSAPGRNHSPAWSPGGSKIAFVSERDGNAEIYVMNADGANQVRLTNHSAADGDPAWSSDGRTIAFSSDRTGSGDIYSMNADGSDQVRLTQSVFRDRQPAWSPDGTRIAFAGGVSLVVDDIFIMNANGSNLTRLLVPDFVNPAEPAWSPDGRKIAFSGEECGFYDYYGPCHFINIVSTDGIPYSLRINDASDPAWRP